MGWDFTYGASRKDIIREITKGWDGGDGSQTRCLKHAARGNVLWTVFEVERQGSETNPLSRVTKRFIGCHLLRGDRDGWGKKDMSEGMGPYHYSCPLTFLDMVPEPDSVYAREWRGKVRAWHEARKAPLPALGAEIVMPGWRPDRLWLSSHRPLRGVDANGKLYRIPRRAMLPEALR